MPKLTFKEREQLVRDSLTTGMSIEDIAKLVDCEPDFVKVIAEFVMREVPGLLNEVKYHMVYPKDRWVTAQQLIDGATDVIATNALAIDPPTNVDDAIMFLMSFGEVEIIEE